MAEGATSSWRISSGTARGSGAETGFSQRDWCGLNRLEPQAPRGVAAAQSAVSRSKRFHPVRPARLPSLARPGSGGGPLPEPPAVDRRPVQSESASRRSFHQRRDRFLTDLLYRNRRQRSGHRFSQRDRCGFHHWRDRFLTDLLRNLRQRSGDRFSQCNRRGFHQRRDGLLTDFLRNDRQRRGNRFGQRDRLLTYFPRNNRRKRSGDRFG